MIVPGTRVGRYEVVERFSGGGRSQVGRAVVDGRDVVLKQFHAPRYPTDPARVDPERLGRLRAACARFEARHREVMDRLADTVLGGGNLVKPIDFFRDAASYYKAFPLVPHDRSDVAALDDAGQQVFVRTLLLGLRELHVVEVVHGDLKPDNVLLERKPGGPVARLIDVDEAYVARHPPPQREVGGDAVYLSPELAVYEATGQGPDRLTTQSDVFALGLLIHRLVHGVLPATVGGTGDSVAERVRAGGTVRFTPLRWAPAGFNQLLRHTVGLDPGQRPTVHELAHELGLPLEPPAARPPVVSPSESRVRSTMGRRTAGRRP